MIECAIGIVIVLAVLTLLRCVNTGNYLIHSRIGRGERFQRAGADPGTFGTLETCPRVKSLGSRGQGPTSPNQDSPHVSVLMPLRGSDPMLEAAIRSILEQDYPNFDFWIIVDSKEDPGWSSVHSAIQKLGAQNVFVRELESKSRTCSLLCSAVVQFIEAVRGHSEIIAFCASDGIVPTGWLRHMVSALSDSNVGSTLGNRWYVPLQGRWGSVVRYLWNVEANVHMWLYRIPWSGTVALRITDVERAGLTQIWGQSMIEDAHLTGVLREIDLKMKYVPELIVVNHEEISLGNCFRFLKRQFFWTHVYHDRFRSVFAIALVTGLGTLLPLVFALVAMLQGAVVPALLSLGALAGHVLVLGGLLWGMERSVRQRMEPEARRANRLPWHVLLKLPLAIPLAQIVCFGAVIASQFVRIVNWRGVRYRVDGPRDCELIEYAPFQTPVTSDQWVSVES